MTRDALIAEVERLSDEQGRVGLLGRNIPVPPGAIEQRIGRPIEHLDCGVQSSHDCQVVLLGAPTMLGEAYSNIAPGAFVVFFWPTSDFALGGLAGTARDRCSRSVYMAGFANPHYVTTRDGLVVSAQRSSLLPPTEREQVLSVIVPVYNERETFQKVINELLSVSIEGVQLEITIVESNSTDGTREEVLAFESEPHVSLILEDRPRGKGHAVRAGLARASGDFVLIQDADLEYEISDYESLLVPLRSGEASFVLGVRTKTAGAKWGIRHFERQATISQLMNIGNWLFLTLFNTVYGQHLRDPFTMFKVVRRDCLDGLRLESNRFDFDWELTGKLVRRGYAPLEIPVSYRSRSFDDGKKISLTRDPLTWIRACFKYRFSSFED